MGVDIKLLPMHLGGKYSQFSLSILNFRPTEEEYNALKSVIQYECDREFESYCPDSEENADQGFGKTTEDKYGNRVRWAYAKDLKKCALPAPEKAYISALNDDFKIALYWC